MRYLNKKTGAVIDSSFDISGGDWFLEGKTDIEITKESAIVEPPKVEEAPKQEPIATQATAKGANDAYDSITVPQIKQELDAFGIEYDKRANKQVLYDLMMQGK